MLRSALISLFLASVFGLSPMAEAQQDLGGSQQAPSELSDTDLQDIDSLLGIEDGNANEIASSPDDFAQDLPTFGEEIEENQTGLATALTPLFIPGNEEYYQDEEEEDAPEVELLETNGVLIRGLDKITGRTTDLHVASEGQFLYGGLRVTVRACHQTPPTEPPESIAYLEVEDYGFQVSEDEITSDDIDLERRIFKGWMYASSPGIHALEHPVYDVWVIRCMADAPSAPTSNAS